MESSAASLSQQLKAIPVFSDLSLDDLAWLASRMELVQSKPGDIVVTEGSPADRMFVILEGELAMQREQGMGDGRTYSARAGQVTGMLPYSRLTEFPLTVRAMTPATVAFLRAERFPEMLKRLPDLGSKLVGVLTDRVRETTRRDRRGRSSSRWGNFPPAWLTN